ncbi:MAG: C_GCAxxG_C_C family protein [Deltaproteobacteria bacterium]|nr:C_GCAxxG_C_C family protein [Deltaproteobacteria bacterium]
MDAESLDVLRLAGQGLCCSQILVALALEDRGEDNPALIRAVAGLCNGVGDCAQTCGALTGGACVLGLYAGPSPGRPAHDRFPLMLQELTEWFGREAVAGCGGARCLDILGPGGCGHPDAERCGRLVLAVRARVLTILVDNGLDPTGKDDEP